jgi:hypothetical protein
MFDTTFKRELKNEELLEIMNQGESVKRLFAVQNLALPKAISKCSGLEQFQLRCFGTRDGRGGNNALQASILQAILDNESVLTV